jgi:hypothetical protein
VLLHQLQQLTCSSSNDSNRSSKANSKPSVGRKPGSSMSATVSAAICHAQILGITTACTTAA